MMQESVIGKYNCLMNFRHEEVIKNFEEVLQFHHSYSYNYITSLNCIIQSTQKGRDTSTISNDITGHHKGIPFFS